MAKKVTPAASRHRKFVLEYCRNGFRSTDAAIKAGYTPSRAATRAWHILRRPEVQKMLIDIVGPSLERARMSAEETIARLSRQARSDIRLVTNADGSLLTPGEMDDDAAACVAAIEVEEKGDDKLVRKLKLRDPFPALNALARMYGIIEGQREEQPIEGEARELNAQDRIDAARRIAFALTAVDVETIEVNEAA
jgi:hypothetical protein